MERQADYVVEPVGRAAPVVLVATRSRMAELGDGIAASVRKREDGRYTVLVSDQIAPRYEHTVAHHAMSHLGDPDVFSEVTAWCERATCWAARAWLPVVPDAAIAGL